MGEERWPKICLEERIKNTDNRYRRTWGKRCEKSFRMGRCGKHVGNLQARQKKCDDEKYGKRIENKARVVWKKS